MARSTLALFAASLVTLAALAGCITGAADPAPGSGGDPATDAPPVEADALQHLEAAKSLALGWRSDARLVAVSATEGPTGMPVDPPIVWDTSADPTVGNGLALVWTYLFYAPGEDHIYFVSMSGAGEALYQNALLHPEYMSHGYGYVAYAEPAPASDGAAATTMDYPCCGYRRPEPPALETPAVGSAAAAAAAAAGNESFRDFGALHPVHGMTILLGPYGPEGAGWVLQKRTATFYSVTAAVDADTGNLTSVHEYPYVWTPPPCCDPPCCYPCCEPDPWVPEDYSAEHAAEGDALGYRHIQFVFPVDYPDLAVSATLHLEVTGADLEPLRARLLDPMGAEVGRFTLPAGDLALTSFPHGGSYRVVVEPETLGTYLFDHEATFRVLVDYEAREGPGLPEDTTLAYAGVMQGMPGTEHWYEIFPEWGIESVTIGLDYEETPAAATLALRVYDMYGNVAQESEGPSNLTLSYLQAGAYYYVGVVAESPALLPQEYELTLAYDYPEAVDGAAANGCGDAHHCPVDHGGHGDHATSSSGDHHG